ncbi:23S rRNA (guanine(1835)-N(2))-methyltransferase RlmG [Scandinavium sp. V105_16]|uniref:Ribosomal RNA large subunit methyltransferase G n=1 Tax=Scandinavium lactucae TaxID=3095028 RepID=A0AAJ2S9E4_9ENTR|nr:MULTISPECIES: 23S rRNA (guanine(1835)-N(2))-methyltransferase RlmG [unclassified Scandinavium]MDX6020222.1 23S rRNA (guanine(1835)-N(2))-methyltransferase RlmG [Scandinavium sp. V105_16]MDX6032211.1 23S rRNA (guanine(1835)-N(2))-methyltransferase RlmG [Scandinavium sp. V105_12]MDX6040776.1 23S rRNA (guanine(1835)-N(2))-methyltransferase RlmG [Scandinavium sp. V105_6]MDX6051680.1 23S rRNA (guanine(1835)-N(2))-methyltransferase RlmG [Scandinavium sp. V105_1]
MSQSDNGFRSLTLKRFPETDDVSPLQAWEAADEYLLQQLDGTDISGPVLVFNDTFGALACALAEHQPYSIGDSYLSELATRENLRHNDIPENSVTFRDSTGEYPAAPAVVLIKIPKTLALLEQQLRALRQVVTPETRIIGGAKARDVHNSTLELFEKILGPTTTTLAWKKARLINCTFNAPALEDVSQVLSWPLEGTNWTIHNHANVFSRTGLDIGARFFMEHLPSDLEGEIVDLGCGNGVVGLSLLERNPLANVVFVDESPMAVSSSRMNVEANMPEALDRCEFMINNALSGVEPFRFNAVLCNPPFHQQHALTDNIAWEMFHHARRCLKINGELVIVANRHLDYFHKLKKIFGNCTTIATNQKFVILKAVKLGRNR